MKSRIDWMYIWPTGILLSHCLYSGKHFTVSEPSNIFQTPKNVLLCSHVFLIPYSLGWFSVKIPHYKCLKTQHQSSLTKEKKREKKRGRSNKFPSQLDSGIIWFRGHALSCVCALFVIRDHFPLFKQTSQCCRFRAGSWANSGLSYLWTNKL